MNEIGKNKKMRIASEKATIVKRYLSGESPKKLAKEIDSTVKMVIEWTNKYEKDGI